MIINRSHTIWGFGTLVATIGLGVLYVGQTNPGALPFNVPVIPANLPWLKAVEASATDGDFGATPLGLLYGMAGLLIFIFAALLGWRRKRINWPIGSVQFWLRGHIWLTVLTIPLVLFHCNFKGGGPMTEVLLGLYAFVMLSGFYGLALQNVLPKLMRDYLPEEVIFDQIPHVRQLLVKEAERIYQLLQDEASGRALHHTHQDHDESHHSHGHGKGSSSEKLTSNLPSLISFIEKDGIPYLKSPSGRHQRLVSHQVSDNLFHVLNARLDEDSTRILERLQDLCDEKRRLDLQVRLHFWLHSWLIIHAPASLILIVVTIWHAIVATFLYS